MIKKQLKIVRREESTMYDLRLFIDETEKIVARHNLGETGKYARWITQDETGSRNLKESPYGCANAANILYTINRFPTDPADRAAFVKVLQGFQNKETGIFEDADNYPTHSTAFISGALALFDVQPLFRVSAFSEYVSREGLFRFLDRIDWAKQPWLGAHLGSGIYASMILTGTASDQWEDNYFEWMDSNADPVTGLWKKDALEGADPFAYLAGTFHYVFNYEYAKRALPYPKELLETCIQAYRSGLCPDFTASVGWFDIDYTYMLSAAQRRAGGRYEETKKILKEIADGMIPQLLAMDPETSETLNDLHTLFALLCALAVLQDELPGYIRTSKPLNLVLDKRPFL